MRMTDGQNLTLMIDNIKKIREHGNFQTLKNEIGEVELKNLLLTLYTKHTIKEIEDMIKVPDSTLARWFSRFEINTEERWHIEAFSTAGDENNEELVRNGNKIKKHFTVKITPDLAYLIGFSLGDGSLQKYTVEVFNKDVDLYHHLHQLLSLFGKIEEKKLRSNGLWVLRLNSVKISNLVKKNKQIDKSTIDYIFRRKELAKKFIAAFWDAEGSVRRQNSNYYNIYLYNTNEYLMNKVMRFLNSSGIKYSILSRNGFGRNYTLNGRPIITRKILYRISIPKSSSLVWAEEIGIFMMHSKKKKVVREILHLIDK